MSAPVAQATLVMVGREVVVGDQIVFCPGNPPIRVMSFDPQPYTHPQHGEYRVFYDARDFGYALYDWHRVYAVPR